jgi:hypothetical protein
MNFIIFHGHPMIYLWDTASNLLAVEKKEMEINSISQP